MTDQDEDWLSHECWAGPGKLSPDSLAASDHIEEGEEHQTVGHYANCLHHPNDWQIEAPEASHRGRNTVSFTPVTDVATCCKGW